MSPVVGDMGSEAPSTEGLPHQSAKDRSSSSGRETAGKMKQFASWFTHGVPGGARLRAAIYQEKTGAAVLAQVDAFFTRQLEQGSIEGGAPMEEPTQPALFSGFDPALACGD